MTIFFYPISKREIDCLGKVEALVKASVICPWEGHHKLASTLICSHHLHVSRQRQAEGVKIRLDALGLPKCLNLTHCVQTVLIRHLLKTTHCTKLDTPFNHIHGHNISQEYSNNYSLVHTLEHTSFLKD